ncbi:RSP_2648 family PIN domain-containing protein [Pseudooceanicola spongiae]|uniref:PIN domain-containing protein n=1 Tax=Pseudooceanicola spongiae TaxID=2613965 RepID=A0A7L9WIW6_9RHOB|nr:PIN domain-containing protein [Pseudooceanicola spongiae]QOL80341.1 PIN domain-containing protein [Pseudooceanicola spongiae]
MKAVIDACVLYPTVMREMVLGAAGQGLFTPVWSDRILEEWARAAAKLGADGEAQARAEVAMARVAFPKAEVRYPPELVNRLWLPDSGDLHVLAAAIASSADAIVTVNAKDFPRNILAEEGLSRADPDALLVGFTEASPDIMAPIGARVLAQARAMSDPGWSIRALMRKARLPRLGKALEALDV